MPPGGILGGIDSRAMAAAHPDPGRLRAARAGVLAILCGDLT